MKDLILPLAAILVVTSGAAAVAPDEAKLSAAVDAIAETLQKSPAERTELAGNDWASQLACTADMSGQQPDLIDETKCSSSKDSSGRGCIWCDSTAVIGQGLCVSPDQKAMIGQFWDQLCASSGPAQPDNTPPPPVPVTPSPTPNPTPNPTNPPPAPGPDNVPDEMKCSVDATQNVITDETTCAAMDDPTSTSGEKCAWCKIPILGGSCITASMKAQMSFICQNAEGGEGTKVGNLRGDNNNNDGGWKQLDPSCLGDKSSCAANTDSNGKACVWCDAGNNVFGICATPDQRDYLGSYLNCDAAGGAADAESNVAVE